MRFFCLLAIVFALTSPVRADVYRVIDYQFQGDETQAKQRAIQTVLQRLTGQFEIDPALQTFSDEPEAWIASWTVIDQAAGVAEFKVDSGLRQALARLDLPVWTQPRNLPWLWMVVDEGRGRVPVTGDSDSEVLRQLRLLADEMAVELRLPQWDPADRSEVNLAEFWGLFFDGVERAAQRYPGRYSMARVAKLNERWVLTLRGDKGERLDQQYGSSEQLAKGLFQLWLPPLIEQYAVVGSGDLQLVIRGLDAARYGDFVRSLRDLDVVDRALPVYSDFEEIRFAVQTGARPEQLSRWLGALGLSEVSDETFDLVMEF